MVEKRSVKLIKDFIRYHKNKITEPEFPFDNVSKSITIILSIYWSRWDKMSVDEKKQEIERIKRHSDWCEKNGFLHNSRSEK